MKFLYFTSAYPAAIANFYFQNKELLNSDFETQKKILEDALIVNTASWRKALCAIGYEFQDILYNAEPLQNAWHKENFTEPVPSLREIALQQIKKFKPEILWFDDHDELLLSLVRREVPSIRLVIGWSGSAIPSETFRNVDLMLSCAQESVDFFRNHGGKAEQLHHAFDTDNLERIILSKEKKFGLTFIGQILRINQFHRARANLLEQLSAKVPVDIFSSLSEKSLKVELKNLAKNIAYEVYSKQNLLEKKSALARKLQGFKNTERAFTGRLLQKRTRPAVYGLQMFQTLADSKLVLNIHADSSPHFASNMRLFETTGVGAPLLTDWRDNLASLFNPDEEILSYKSADECIEKAKWCMNNYEAATQIALKAQKRTLKEHNFLVRAQRLESIIRNLV